MKALIPAALVFLGLTGALAGPAFAFQCPADMAKIDAALQTAELTDDQKAQVTELREEGEQQHASGNHQASVDALAEAKIGRASWRDRGGPYGENSVGGET